MRSDALSFIFRVWDPMQPAIFNIKTQSFEIYWHLTAVTWAVRISSRLSSESVKQNVGKKLRVVRLPMPKWVTQMLVFLPHNRSWCIPCLEPPMLVIFRPPLSVTKCRDLTKKDMARNHHTPKMWMTRDLNWPGNANAALCLLERDFRLDKRILSRHGISNTMTLLGLLSIL